MKTVKVVFDIPLNQEFDYLPGKFDGQFSVGARVLAPLGKQRKIGWVSGFGETDDTVREWKEILKVYDRESLITPDLLDLAVFAAQRYFCSAGQVLAAINKRLALQGGARKNDESAAPETPDRENTGPLPAGIEPGRFGEYIVRCAGPKEREDFYLSAASSFGAGSVLFIFPEVAGAEGFYRRLRANFGARAALFHGGLSRTAKAAVWERMRRERNLLVAGSRISVFSPLTDLRAVCVDNFWDSSYREQQSPHYQAAELAGRRAFILGIPLLVGETALSVEQWHRVRTGEAVSLPGPGASLPAPEIHCLALSGASRDKTLPFFARDTVSLLEETLVRGGRVMLLHNRKGTTRLLVCGKCDHRLTCDGCGAFLALAEGVRRMRCPQCGAGQPLPRICPRCGAGRITAKGFGVDRIEDLLGRRYPSVRIVRQTADDRKAEFPADARIVLGTQAAVRRLESFRPDLVVIVSGDAFLSRPDYRVEEKFFLLCREVAAALRRRGDRLVIQASDPDLAVYRALRDNAPEKFYDKELPLRKQLGYPPFGVVVRVELEAAQKTTLERRKKLADDFLAGHALPVVFSGPSTPHGRKNGWKYVLKADSFDRIRPLAGLNDIVACAVALNPESL